MHTDAETDHVEFAILGAGAIGSIIGSHLARSRRSVVMLARGPRARQLQEAGITIKGLAEFTQAVRVITEPSRLKAADVLIVATKTHGTKGALEPLRHVRVGTALSIQNGLSKNEELVARWGDDHVLGALADTSGELLASGETVFTRNENICIGELKGGTSARSMQLAGVIDASGVRTRAVPDIESLEWSKFCAWSALMVVSVTTRAVTWKYLVDAASALVIARIIREVASLAAARNILLSDCAPLPVASIARMSEENAVVLIQTLGGQMRLKAPQHRMSSLQDLEAGRPLEVEETLGYAVRAAAMLKVSVPLLASFHPLTAAIDRIRRAELSSSYTPR